MRHASEACEEGRHASKACEKHASTDREHRGVDGVKVRARLDSKLWRMELHAKALHTCRGGAGRSSGQAKARLRVDEREAEVRVEDPG